MQTLGLDDEIGITDEPKTAAESRPAGFWKRQFQQESTHKQRVFDWLFGVVMPVVCFAFDPFIFKGGAGIAFAGVVKPFAYILSYVSILALMAWLLFGARLKWLNGMLAGLFAVGGTISLVVGIFLFPFSLMGLIVLVGALGFTPLFTAVIYLRNAARAYRAARPFIEKRVLLPTFLLTALFSGVIPATVNMEIRRSMNSIRFGNAETVRTVTARLKYAKLLVDPYPIALAYFRVPKGERQSERMQALAAAYYELTGIEIEKSEWMVND